MADARKPNILIIWGDDIGWFNVSAYNLGVMGYRTPNIDRIAREGMLFTDWYGQQSCTAGRAAFITGQTPFRTGLTKVGVPGSPLGLSPEDPTLAELLKPHGYATAQFGRNHFGDRDEHLPTNRGFDEFYGNLYHLNAEEEPELRDWPPDALFPNFRNIYAARGVLHCFSDGTIEETGPLTRKRMETIGDDVAEWSANWIEAQARAGVPFFVWVSFTHMHLRTHAKAESLGQSGLWQSEYHDVMIDHDKNVGTVLDKNDELGIADNTIVFYSTDNGPHMNSWPDGGMTPFRSEKNTNWEGGFRVPALVRWPGKIKAGAVCNEIMAHQDWVTTLMAAVGEADINEKLLKGHEANGKSFRVRLDGYNFLFYLLGEPPQGPRQGFLYFSDDGELVAVRFHNWKVVFAEQRRTGTLGIWGEPFIPLRMAKMLNLRCDPYERADITSNTYYDWLLDHIYLMAAAAAIVEEFVKTCVAFPPRQKPGTFTVNQILERLQNPHMGAS